MRVVPLVTTRALGGPLDYALPPGAEPLGVGTVVRVPLAGRRVRGVVVPADGAPAHEGELAVVEAVEPLAVAPSLVDLALWLASYYGSTPGTGARAGAAAEDPPGRRRRWSSPCRGAEPATRRRRGDPGRARRRPAAAGRARAACRHDGAPPCAGWPQDGLVRIEQRLHRTACAAPRRTRRCRAATRPRRSSAIEALLDAGGGELLLHGVTGSGKTEVYLAAIAATLGAGSGALVLVPEIALTPQTAGRIAARFGERVAVLHSALGDGERAAAHARIRARRGRRRGRRRARPSSRRWRTSAWW